MGSLGRYPLRAYPYFGCPIQDDRARVESGAQARVRVRAVAGAQARARIQIQAEADVAGGLAQAPAEIRTRAVGTHRALGRASCKILCYL